MQMNEEDLTKEEKEIKHVAIYARKSRGDEDHDLDKHIFKMESLCKVYGWSYEIKKEMFTGNSIEDLEELNKLLDEIENQTFDAIVVMEQDRLTRGGTGDQQKINYILKKSDTKIVTATPYYILDLNNEAHEEMMMFKSISSQLEYKMIKKRFKTGKKISQNMGNWAYGTAPFGYRYNRDSKRLEPDEEESVTFRKIIDMFFDGKFSTDIAWELNKEGYTTRGGNKWNDGTIRAMMKNEVYTGRTVYNKTQGTPENRTKNRYSITNPFRVNDRSQWQVIENTHEALVSIEEHQRIIDYYDKASKHQKGKSKSTYALSGLCVTPDHKPYSIRNMGEGRYLLRVPNSDYMELYCDIVEASIRDSVNLMKEAIEKNLEEKDTSKEEKEIEAKIDKLKDRANVVSSAINRTMEGYTEGLYDIDTAKRIKLKKELEYSELEEEIRKNNERLKSVSNVDNIDRKKRLDKFLYDIENSKSHSMRNKIYKEVISEIVVHRESRTRIRVKVNFL